MVWRSSCDNVVGESLVENRFSLLIDSFFLHFCHKDVRKCYWKWSAHGTSVCLFVILWIKDKILSIVSFTNSLLKIILLHNGFNFSLLYTWSRMYSIVSLIGMFVNNDSKSYETYSSSGSRGGWSFSRFGKSCVFRIICGFSSQIGFKYSGMNRAAS